MERALPIRRHTRYPVRWAMRYGTERFVAEGTVLDVTDRGWRLAGPVPVQPGMQIWIQVCPPDTPSETHMVSGKVLWTKGWEYALSIDENPYWVKNFLGKALSRWLYQSPERAESARRSANETARHDEVDSQPIRRRDPWKCPLSRRRDEHR